MIKGVYVVEAVSAGRKRLVSNESSCWLFLEDVDTRVEAQKGEDATTVVILKGWSVGLMGGVCGFGRNGEW